MTLPATNLGEFFIEQSAYFSRSGSAAIKESQYIKDGGKFHSRQIVRERLGKVVWLASDGKSGIFLSPSRGLVSYDAVSDSFDEVGRDDERLCGGSVDVFPDTEIHTVFGDAHLLFCFLVKSGMAEVLKIAFPDEIERERVLCHILHGILRDGSRISCDNFIEKSFASYVLEDVPAASLRYDTAYFSMMGKDSVRLAFFKAFVERMRNTNPDFGKCCYVDSSPLPNDIDNNPFNALQRERNYMLDHPEEYAALKDKEKDWMSVRFGYFVLLSNKKLEPVDLLTEYFGRTDIEGVIKTSKEYLGLLPLAKWSADTVRGKILGDIMNTIIFLNMRKALDESGLSVSEVTGKTQSLMCFRNKHGEILIETPNKKSQSVLQAHW